jgi:prepilin-type N-terminal cleavage/methylation domain-containing protein
VVKAAFTLVEVVVSMALLAVGALGLAASAAVGHRAFAAAEIQERSVRHAAVLLDSLAIGSTAASEDSLRTDGIRLHWSAGTGAGAEVRVTAVYLRGGKPVTLRFTTRRMPTLPVRAP